MPPLAIEAVPEHGEDMTADAVDAESTSEWSVFSENKAKLASKPVLPPRLASVTFN